MSAAQNADQITAALRETFRAYVAAESSATRAFLAYKFGEVTEAEVNRLQRAERVAADAHTAAINALADHGAELASQEAAA